MLHHRLFSAFVGCMVLLLSASAGRAGDAEVSGKLTLDGKPLAGARVIFHLEKGQFVGTTTSEDGSYLVGRVPEGARKWSATRKLVHVV
jgi:hypothetical protein